MIVIFSSEESLNTAIPLPPDVTTLPNGIQIINQGKRVLPSGTEMGELIKSADGRVAMSHYFSEEDLTALQSIVGVVVSESLPEDWQYSVGEIR